MQQLSISEIQRNLHKLDNFDIIEIIDKKRNKIKGYFIDTHYLSSINALVEKKKGNSLITEQLAGSLHKYAKPDLIKEEDTAWQKHIKKKYAP